jgi:hypothetical protein
MQEMRAGADPGLVATLEPEIGDALGRHQPAIGDVARKARRLLAEERRAHRGDISAVEQSRDESVDAARDAVGGQCVSDRAPLACEMGTLAQGDGGGNALCRNGSFDEFTMQRLLPVVLRYRQFPGEVVEMARAAGTPWLHRDNARNNNAAVQNSGQISGLMHAAGGSPIGLMIDNDPRIVGQRSA